MSFSDLFNMIISRSIHVAANSIISFFFMSGVTQSRMWLKRLSSSSSGPWYICATSLFIHLLMDIWLFPCPVTVNTAAVNTGVHVSFQSVVFSRYMPRSGVAGSYGNSQCFKETPYWLHQIPFPPTVQEGSLLSTPSPAFIIGRLFDDGHSDWCEVITQCSLDLHVSNNYWCWVSFHVPTGHLYVKLVPALVFHTCSLRFEHSSLVFSGQMPPLHLGLSSNLNSSKRLSLKA